MISDPAPTVSKRQAALDSDSIHVTCSVRLHHEGVLGAGVRLSFPASTSHRLRRVLRLGEGSALRVFNAEYGEWLAQLGSGKEMEAICVQQLRSVEQGIAEQQGPTLYFSPIRPHRMAVLVSGAVELGVSRLQPFTSHFTRASFSFSRVERMVCAAVEQSERLTFPRLLPLRRLDALAFPESHVLFCAEHGSADPIARAVRRLEGAVEGRLGVLIGPEGGFSHEEHRLLRAHSCLCAVSMGSRVLRSETAVLAALSCLQASLGDWARTRTGKATQQQGQAA